MKKIMMALMALAILACNDKSDNAYVTLQGQLKNAQLDSIYVVGKEFNKAIKLNEDGSFKDTLKVTDGFHGLSTGNQRAFIYLKNGYDLTVNMDLAQMPESLTFDGQGSETNNYMAGKLKFISEQKLTDYASFFSMDKPEFDERMAQIKSDLEQLLADAPGIDKEVYTSEVEMNEKLLNFFSSNYESEHLNYVGIRKGDPSPSFNYENQFGKNVSLGDLKGKYVYIDVWATWCAPCKREIPFLKEMDEAYKGKDIAFVSLSIDKMEQKDKWLKMIEDEDLKGIQVIADKDWNSDFITAYKIKGIPRFILVDKEGNIINSDAPRPSDPSLKEVLNTLEL